MSELRYTASVLKSHRIERWKTQSVVLIQAQNRRSQNASGAGIQYPA